ncbi:MAG: hypothetical protein M1834_006286 [Cirrosporium novae-zelandiae]|nr:MAG: hypothetical protein M1834_006286 [Cirrosporium novae-zelandiae]
MIPLNPDRTFHFELLRVLAHARYYGADIAEVLEASSQIEPGNFESWCTVFTTLAYRVESYVDSTDAKKYPVSVRDALFRASSYYRAADFYLHGDPYDPRINELWDRQTKCFDRAMTLLDTPGERVTIKTEAFEIPTIFFRAKGGAKIPKPTIILGNGFDGSQEEMMHTSGFAALERGYNVITYEGPGQCSVRRSQNLGFIYNWEKVVTPIIDHYANFPEVEEKQVALLGHSFGGYLAARAAAFEHRIAAVILIDGLYSFYDASENLMPDASKSLLESGGEILQEAMLEKIKAMGTMMRWAMDQGMWSFNVATSTEFLEKAKMMTLDGIVDKIQCPVWVGDAAEDQFFKGQPQKVADAVGERATLVVFTAKDGAANHCHAGAAVRMNQLVFEWLQENMIDSQK